MEDEYESRRTSKLLIGTKHGKLTAIEWTQNNGRSFVICKCDCGNIVTRRSDGFKANRFLSCGCSKRSKTQPSGPASPSFSGVGAISKTHFARIQRTAERRGIVFNITIDEIAKLYETQDRKCAYTALPITFGRLQHHHETTASLDRIDSSVGYIISNVQWVHKDINTMKSIFSHEYFIHMCQLVSAKSYT